MTNLNALIASRICHDLINPLGAIGNGIELIEMAGAAAGPEMELVTGSVENATSKLKFLRLAFGAASADQVVGHREITSILAQVTQGSRLNYIWNVQGDAPRLEVRVALLAAMCVETALPLGGDIDIGHDAQGWSVQARHDRLNLDPALWVPLSKGSCPPELSAAQVHFGLLPDMAAAAARQLSMTHGADWVIISF